MASDAMANKDSSMPAEGSLGGLAQRRSRMTDPLNRPPPRLGTRSMKAGKTLGFCSPPRVGCGSPGTLPPGSIGVSTDRRAHFRDGFLRQREQSSLQRRCLRGAARNKPWFCGGLECRADESRDHSCPPETILFVEDDALVRMDMAEYLRECGYRVHGAANAAERRRPCKRNSPSTWSLPTSILVKG